MTYLKSAKRTSIVTSVALIVVMNAGCGRDDGDDNSEDAGPCAPNPGSGCVVGAEGKKVTVSFSEKEKGGGFILMPYALGKLGAVPGAQSSKTVLFKIKKGGQKKEAKLVPLRAPRPALSHGFTSTGAGFQKGRRGFAMRVLYNRFDPERGLKQGQEFWSVTEAVDAAVSPDGRPQETDGPITRRFMRMAREGDGLALAPSEASNPLTTLEACPQDDILVPNKNGRFKSDNPTRVAPQSTDGGDGFCIAYLSDPTTEPNKDKIKSSVATVIDRYKSKIYPDSDWSQRDGYSFKPLVVIGDFSDGSVWPPAQNDPKELQISGVFLQAASKQLDRPVLYMAADFEAVGEGRQSDDVTRDVWHGTLAHEMQHAALEFLRRPDGVLETIAIDEGIAHFMEDVFGYGTENFDSYAGSFLSTFAFGSSPFLDGGANVVQNDVARGAAHAFAYYLMSRQGGVDFQDGVVSGGEGFTYIRKVVKNATVTGPKNLAAHIDRDWTTVVGEFLGSLILDGSRVKEVEEAFEAQDPTSGVKDLTGHNDKKFGMKFNGNGDPSDRFSEYKQYGALSLPAERKQKYYQTKPYFFKVEDPATSLVFETDTEVKNTAVAVIRID